MDLKARIEWVYKIHQKAVDILEHTSATCPECAFFTDKKNFNPKLIRNFGWGLCPEHLEKFEKFWSDADKLHWELEREMGVYSEYGNGYFRRLPDGRLCTIHSRPWLDYLLSLCQSS